MDKLILALIVWTIDKDLMKTPVHIAWELFQKDAVGCQKIYTDPDDKLLYCANVVNMNPIEFFTDYILFYAKSRVMSNVSSYGIYDKYILTF